MRTPQLASCISRIDLAVGQEVTILYDPANPQTNGIHRCGEFDVLTSDDKTL